MRWQHRKRDKEGEPECLYDQRAKNGLVTAITEVYTVWLIAGQPDSPDAEGEIHS